MSQSTITGRDQLAFLSRQGSIRVGPGSTVKDIQRARKLRGIEKGMKPILIDTNRIL